MLLCLYIISQFSALVVNKCAYNVYVRQRSNISKAYDIIKLAAHAVRYKQTDAVINLIIYFLTFSAVK